MACDLPVIVSNKVNIWREIAAYRAGLICDDTFEGTNAALSCWAELSPEEIADLREKARKCFDEMFNYKATSKKVLETIERLAGAKVRNGEAMPRA
jgi:glycosyltransferase involved in cell wall biosynthesis